MFVFSDDISPSRMHCLIRILLQLGRFVSVYFFLCSVFLLRASGGVPWGEVVSWYCHQHQQELTSEEDLSNMQKLVNQVGIAR